MIVSCMCHENQTKVKGRSWPGKSRDQFTTMTGDRIFLRNRQKVRMECVYAPDCCDFVLELWSKMRCIFRNPIKISDTNFFHQYEFRSEVELSVS